MKITFAEVIAGIFGLCLFAGLGLFGYSQYQQIESTIAEMDLSNRVDAEAAEEPVEVQASIVEPLAEHGGPPYVGYTGTFSIIMIDGCGQPTEMLMQITVCLDRSTEKVSANVGLVKPGFVYSASVIVTGSHDSTECYKLSACLAHFNPTECESVVEAFSEMVQQRVGDQLDVVLLENGGIIECDLHPPLIGSFSTIEKDMNDGTHIQASG